MAAFKDPSFTDRAAAAAAAKAKALEKLRAKPPVDPAELAQRTAEREARDRAAAEKRAAAREAKEAAAAEAKAAKLAAAQAAQAAAPVPTPAAPPAPVLTEAERKAARDARYAARKKRTK